MPVDNRVKSESYATPTRFAAQPCAYLLQSFAVYVVSIHWMDDESPPCQHCALAASDAGGRRLGGPGGSPRDAFSVSVLDGSGRESPRPSHFASASSFSIAALNAA